MFQSMVNRLSYVGSVMSQSTGLGTALGNKAIRFIAQTSEDGDRDGALNSPRGHMPLT